MGNKELLEAIKKKLIAIASVQDHAARLKKLFELHRRYVAQASITERYGDLTDQIDETFDIDHYARTHKITTIGQSPSSHPRRSEL